MNDDLLNRILDAKTKGATFTADELAALERLAGGGSGGTKQYVTVKPKKVPLIMPDMDEENGNPCLVTWYLRGKVGDAHRALSPASKGHGCKLNAGHIGRHICRVCGHTRNDRDLQPAVKLAVGLFEKKAFIPKKKVDPEEAGQRDHDKHKVVRDYNELVTCQLCMKPTKKSSMPLHKFLIHTEEGAQHMRERGKYLGSIAKREFKCQYCKLDMNGLGATIGHLIKVHKIPKGEATTGLAEAMAKKAATPARVVADNKPELSIMEQIILSEIDGEHGQGASFGQLCKAASATYQKMEHVLEHMFKMKRIRVSGMGPDRRYLRW